MRNRSAVLVLLIALVATACGGGDADITTDGVASVTDLDEVTSAEDLVATEDDAADQGIETQEDSALALASCMRDNGFEDFPDPVIDANGNLGFGNAAANSGIDFRDPEVRTQLQECAEGAGFEGGRGANRPDPETLAEQFLTYTQCLRDEGLDVGDLEFGQPGGGQGQAQRNGDGAGAGRGQAQGQGGAGGNRSGFIANRLGLDIEDPAVVAAMSSCEQVLEDALAGLGAPGAQRPAGAQT